jgi:hypothetical protein
MTIALNRTGETDMMRTWNSTLTGRTAALVAALLMMAGPALADPTIVWIGNDYPTDMNADGTVVVGNLGDGSYDVFRWTADSGVVPLGQSTARTIGGGAGSPDVSDDGNHVSASVVDADTLYQTQGIWTKGVGWEFFTPPTNGGLLYGASCWGLSGDGTTATGFYWKDNVNDGGTAQPNTWNRVTDTYEALPFTRNCRVNDTNYDGTLHVGWSERPDGVWCPTVWEDGVLTQLNTRTVSVGIEGISSDETILYGASLDTTNNIPSATIWIRDGLGGWTEQILGALPGTFSGDNGGYVTCRDISADNSIIVGYNAFSRFSQGTFVWTLDEGMMTAEAYFTARGVTLPANYEYGDLAAVSDDGNVYAGFAWDTSTFPYTPHGFVITLNDVSAAPEGPAYRGVALESNYPNPFNPTTAIPVVLERDGAVTLTIYDARGRAVRTLHDGQLVAGRHELVWDGRDASGRQTSSGVYMARLSDDRGIVDSRRMMLVK